MNDIIDAEFVELPEDEGGEPRCAVVLLLDTSQSMDGEPIAQLNAGLEEFRAALQDDDLSARRCEVAIVTFGGSVSVAQHFTVVSELPRLAPLAAHGRTPMGAAIAAGIEMVETKKQQYRHDGRAQYRSWIFLVTDGQPTDDVTSVIPRVHQGDAKRSFLFFAVGCLGASMEILTAIAPPSTPPVHLHGVDFREMFRWLSDSLSRVSGSVVGEQLALPPITNWGQITTG